MNILAIETSCDETAAAVVADGRKVLSNVIASQVEEHKLYGGVVPEIASRRHAECISQVTRAALDSANIDIQNIDAVGVTYAPGLIGALLVGVNFAKGLSAAYGLPLVPVHHLRAHIAANYAAFPELEPPFLCLVVSGGHSHIVEVRDYTGFSVLGRTRDDAAGEAFDKAARAMGMPYPGGIMLDKIADSGNPDSYRLPSPKVDGSPYDYSFSGLKTTVGNLLNTNRQKGVETSIPDLSAAYRKKVVDILTDRLFLVAENSGHKKIVLAGGVSANSELRKRVMDMCAQKGYEAYIPPLEYCTDNAAMVGAQAYYEYLAGHTAESDLNAYATMAIDKAAF